MKVYDFEDKQGRVFAFEVSKTLISRRGVCDLVQSIPGARLLSGRKEMREDEFCIFEVQGQNFKAWEPFGDNSRFHIGPEPTAWCEQVAVVRDAFLHHSSVVKCGVDLRVVLRLGCWIFVVIAPTAAICWAARIRDIGVLGVALPWVLFAEWFFRVLARKFKLGL